MLRSGSIHIITFTSSSTVTNLIKILNSLGESDPASLLKQSQVVCIGPVTAQTAADEGIEVHLTAEEATISSLVDALTKLK
jgi:uroporphyrinogen III methyltransferase/synthase